MVPSLGSSGGVRVTFSLLQFSLSSRHTHTCFILDLTEGVWDLFYSCHNLYPIGILTKYRNQPPRIQWNKHTTLSKDLSKDQITLASSPK